MTISKFGEANQEYVVIFWNKREVLTESRVNMIKVFIHMEERVFIQTQKDS